MSAYTIPPFEPWVLESYKNYAWWYSQVEKSGYMSSLPRYLQVYYRKKNEPEEDLYLADQYEISPTALKIDSRNPYLINISQLQNDTPKIESEKYEEDYFVLKKADELFNQIVLGMSDPREPVSIFWIRDYTHFLTDANKTTRRVHLTLTLLLHKMINSRLEDECRMQVLGVLKKSVVSVNGGCYMDGSPRELKSFSILDTTIKVRKILSLKDLVLSVIENNRIDTSLLPPLCLRFPPPNSPIPKSLSDPAKYNLWENKDLKGLQVVLLLDKPTPSTM